MGRLAVGQTERQTSYMSSLSLDAQRVNPAIKKFLRTNPLPSGLKPYQSAIEQFPDVDALLRTMFGLLQAGFSVEQIGEALVKAAAHTQEGTHRCPCCLGWTSDGLTCGYTNQGQLHLLTLCPRCAKRIATGRPTAAMQRNLTAYTRGGAR